MASFFDITKDMIVVEIMLWPPLESLFLFKCVQKSCNILITSLVKDPAFVARLVFNCSKHTSSLIFNEDRSRKRQGILTNFNDDENSNYVANEPSDESWWFESMYRLAHSHCSGIVSLVLHHIIVL